MENNSLQRVFFNEQVTNANQIYSQNNVYQVSPEDAKRFIGEGKAEAVSFPTLEAIENAIKNKVAKHKEEYNEIKDHERFSQNEPERKYQLDQLELKADFELIQLKAKYYEELELLTKETAKRSLTIDFKPDETVTNLANLLGQELTYSSDKYTTLELLAMKVDAMDDKQRLTLLRHFNAISTSALGGTVGTQKSKLNELLSGIKRQLTDGNRLTTFDQDLLKLKALKQSTNPLARYELSKMLKEVE